MKKVCVIGDGAWGTAIATLLAHNGYQVHLWCHDTANVQLIARSHINQRYLPGYILSDHIVATSSLEDAMRDARWIFQAIPVQYLRSVILEAAPCFKQDQMCVVLSKGIEKDTLLLPTQIIDDIFPIRRKK